MKTLVQQPCNCTTVATALSATWLRPMRNERCDEFPTKSTAFYLEEIKFDSDQLEPVSSLALRAMLYSWIDCR